eukprot:gene6027-6637_t
MSIFSSIFSFSSFLSGTIFGALIVLLAAFHLLSAQPNYVEDLKEKALQAKKKYEEEELEEDHALSSEQLEELNKVVDVLEDINSPLKSVGSLLQKIHLNKENDVASLESKMKTIVDYHTMVKLEKDFSDSMCELKDHGKQIKVVAAFLSDMGKTFNSISREISRLSNTAKNNLNKGSASLHKEDLIVSTWWHTLTVALDHMASDQSDLASFITEELMNYSLQIQEEIAIIEKRLLTEGNRQFASLKENITTFENRFKEREKLREKLRVTSSSTASEKDKEKLRRAKLVASEEQLVLQTKKLQHVQREFYGLFPRIASDIQLTILKSIVETQSQLFKLTEGFERTQQHQQSVFKRMKAQLTNAAASLVQLISDGSRLRVEEADGVEPGNFSLALEVMKQRMMEGGVQGYEISLQKVLERLLIQAQLKAGTKDESAAAALSPSASASEQEGRLDMFQEATSCLSASNPALLPVLPRTFGRAIGLETCVWFNAFSGRVYRDIAHSSYFYEWFRSKLTLMLNKGEKERPAYIDRFEVIDVRFGELPPLLLNVKWAPPLNQKKSFKTTNTSNKANVGTSASCKSGKHDNTAMSDVAVDDASDSDEDNETVDAQGKRLYTNEEIASKARDVPETEEEFLYYAACTADMAFRSGIKFTIATKLFLNWPRDRYVSVPVILHLDLAELSGRIRFGVTKAYSFLTFLKDPMMRISVRSEVGNEKYKIRDIPQVSEFIERKLKNFIHRKIVYPHSHKFRLIWPRNWWPEGTENLFMGSSSPPTSPRKAADNTKESEEGVAAAAAAAAAAAGGGGGGAKKRNSHPPSKETSSKETSTKETKSRDSMKSKLSSWLSGKHRESFTSPAEVSASSTTTTTTTTAVEAVPTNKQVQFDEANEADEASHNETALRDRSRTVSGQAADLLSRSQPQSSAAEDTLSDASSRRQSVVLDRWRAHLESVRSRGSHAGDEVNLDGSLPTHWVSEERKRTVLSYYFNDLHDSFLEDNDHDNGDLSHQHRSYSMDHFTAHNTVEPLLKKSISVSDFRSESAEIALDYCLHVLDVEGEELQRRRRRSDSVASSVAFEPREALSSPPPLEYALPANESSRERRSSDPQSKPPVATRRVRPRGGGGGRGGQQSSRQEDMKTFLAKGREQMERAKQRFKDFKNKHFLRGGGGAEEEEEGEEEGIDKSLHAKIGDKLKNFLFADEDQQHQQPPANEAIMTRRPSMSRIPLPTTPPPAATSSASAVPGSSPQSQNPVTSNAMPPPRPPRPHPAPQPHAEEGGGAAGSTGTGTSSAMKYVASIFRGSAGSPSAEESEAASGGQRRRSSLLRSQSATSAPSEETPTATYSTSSSSSSSAAAVGAAGAAPAHKESRMKDMFSKAFASVRQQLEKDS